MPKQRPYRIVGTGDAGRVVVTRKAFRDALRQATKLAKTHGRSAVFGPDAGSPMATCKRYTARRHAWPRSRRVVAECHVYARGRLILKREKA